MNLLLFPQMNDNVWMVWNSEPIKPKDVPCRCPCHHTALQIQIHCDSDEGKQRRVAAMVLVHMVPKAVGNVQEGRNLSGRDVPCQCQQQKLLSYTQLNNWKTWEGDVHNLLRFGTFII